TLKGFAFVSHGADDNTTVSIAASAASKGGKAMKAEVKAWAESMGIDVENIDDDQKAAIEANYAGLNAKAKKAPASSNPFEQRKIEAQRRNGIREVADKFISMRGEWDVDYITAVEKMCNHAIEANMSVQEFRAEMYEASFADARPMRPTPKQSGLTNRILEAALCQAGRLPNIEKHFSDEELQLAYDRFRDGIGLNQFIMLCAEANGYRSDSASRVTLDAQRAAFRMHGGYRPI